MITIRRAHERGQGNLGWAKAFYTFSFARYYDPEHIHFSDLRVINEDFIDPNGGFGMHPHDNMEILTYVLEGSVAHRDSMGNDAEIKAGEFQIMSAGIGVMHSEINPSTTERLHLYQIWIIPNQLNVAPRYEQKQFENKVGATLILSPEGEHTSFKVYQDMKLWRYQYPSEKEENITLNPTRKYWLQVVKGTLQINNETLSTSDAIALENEDVLHLKTLTETEFLLFDLKSI